MGIGSAYQMATKIQDEPFKAVDYPIANPRSLLAFVKLAIQDLLPLASLPQHKSIKIYGESAIEMIDSHCVVYDLEHWSLNKDLDPELQALLARSAEVIKRLLRVKPKTHEEED